MKAVSDEKEHCQEGDLLKLVRIAFPNEWPFFRKGDFENGRIGT